MAGLGGRGGESEIVAGQAWDALRRALAAGGGAASPGLRPVLVRLLAVARPPGVVGSEAQRLMESLHEQLTDAAIPDAAGLAAAWRLVQRLERVTALPAPVVAERALADAPAAPREVELEEEEASVGIPLDAPLVDAGVDDDLAAELAAAGVATLHDLLTLVPAHEVSLAPVIGAGRPMPDGAVAVGGRVRARVTTCLPDGGLFAAVHLHGAGPATVGWSGPLRAADLARLAVDEKVVVTAEHLGGGRLTGGRLARSDGGRAWRVEYGRPDEAAVQEALAVALGELPRVEEPMPAGLVARYDVAPIASALAEVVVRGRAAEESRRRLALHELTLHELARSWTRFQPGGERGVGHGIVHRGVVELEWLGHIAPPSGPQLRALELVKRDLQRTLPMQRVLFGATAHEPELVALLATLLVTEARSQVLVISPEAPAALIRSEVWTELLRPVGVSTLLLSGDLRRSDADALRKGEIGVVFAGPAAVDTALEWRRLGLVVVVQSGRYGPPSLGAVVPKGVRPDVLVVASTPVAWPRLVAAWPAWDLTSMCGPVEAPSAGAVWREEQREAAFRALGDAVVQGQQAIIAFPITRGGTDLLDLREAAGLVATLKREVLGDVEVALFHGAQSAAERAATVEGLATGRVRVVISTTLMEILPPLRRPVRVLVEHADRMDLQRLLSWRRLITPQGRMEMVVGAAPRPWGLRAVELIARGATDEEVVAACPEGFPALSDEAGLSVPRLGWCKPEADADLVPIARSIAHELLRSDAALREAETQRIARLAWSAWGRTEDGPNPLPTPRPTVSRRKKRRRRRRS